MEPNSLSVQIIVRSMNSLQFSLAAMRVNARIVREVEPKILQAAQEAEVTRFVPDEFGTHTLALEYGACTLFDAKKDIHKLLFQSGLEWTLIFAGGIFDYFLPNLRMFEKVTTFGNTSLTFPTHDIKDIAAIAARAVVDPRTANKGVQLCANVVTQDEMITLLRRCWPEHDFEIVHVSAEEITFQKEHGDPNAISAKAGAEPDQERQGINYTNFVLGKMASVGDPKTLNANNLYPEYVYKKPGEALSDRKFVFGDDAE